MIEYTDDGTVCVTTFLWDSLLLCRRSRVLHTLATAYNIEANRGNPLSNKNRNNKERPEQREYLIRDMLILSSSSPNYSYQCSYQLLATMNMFRQATRQMSKKISFSKHQQQEASKPNLDHLPTLPRFIAPHPKGCLILFQVQPNASETAIMPTSPEDERIRVRVAAPPVDGAANKELLSYLKKVLRIPASNISIIRGEESRAKDICITGIDPAGIISKLPS